MKKYLTDFLMVLTIIDMKQKVFSIVCLGWAMMFVGFLLFVSRPLPAGFLSADRDTSIKITDRHGIILRESLSLEEGRTTWIEADELSENVIQAVLATEDKRFFSHSGIDLIALGRALVQNIQAGRILSGASTITQQLVKNRLAYPRTVWGKIREMAMALRLEYRLSKQEILAHYLNCVGFSNQVFGIEAASRLYFGKPSRHLSLAESVFLAGLIQAPSRYNPYRHFERALERQRLLLDRMRQQHGITETDYHIARKEHITLISKHAHFKAPHFCDVVLRQLSDESSTPATPMIRTTLDYYLQERVEEIVSTRIDELQEYNVTNAAVLVLDNRQGDVLAFVGSKDFFDETISGQVNGILSLRQPGSTLKPFTYQLALERAYTPATLLPDIRNFPAAPRSFLPQNYDRTYHGPVRLREALACSYNIPAYRLIEEIGVETFYQRLHQFGFDSLQELPSFYGPGLTLGNGEVTLLELTRAYSILARGGKSVEEKYLLSSSSNPQLAAREHQNTKTPKHSNTRPPSLQPDIQLFSPRIVYLLTHILADRQAAVPAFGEYTPLELPFQTAVKTGTSKDYRDNWTVGFTRDYTVGVWVGNFDGTPMRKVSGITGAAPIYHDVMLALYRDYNPTNLLDDPPEGIVTARICPVSGKLVSEDCPHGIEEVFLAETAPAKECDMHEAYWVDARDGLLTEATAPNAVKTVFIHFPPLYQNWASEAGYPTPPTRYSSSSQPDKRQQVDLVHEEEPIRIVHPNSGDVYAIDPILRREYQTIQLSAVTSPEIERLSWYVDDEFHESVGGPFQTAWTIAPGRHFIYAEGWHNGNLMQSREITVHIVQ